MITVTGKHVIEVEAVVTVEYDHGRELLIVAEAIDKVIRQNGGGKAMVRCPSSCCTTDGPTWHASGAEYIYRQTHPYTPPPKVREKSWWQRWFGIG